MKIKLGIAILMLSMMGTARADRNVTLINGTDEELQVKDAYRNLIVTIPKKSRKKVTDPRFARVYVPSETYIPTEVPAYGVYKITKNQDSKTLDTELVQTFQN